MVHVIQALLHGTLIGLQCLSVAPSDVLSAACLWVPSWLCTPGSFGFHPGQQLWHSAGLVHHLYRSLQTTLNGWLKPVYPFFSASYQLLCPVVEGERPASVIGCTSSCSSRSSWVQAVIYNWLFSTRSIDSVPGSHFLNLTGLFQLPTCPGSDSLSMTLSHSPLVQQKLYKHKDCHCMGVSVKHVTYEWLSIIRD